MFADFSANLSKYNTIQILLGNCNTHCERKHQNYTTGILNCSRLWQLRSDRMMYDRLYTLIQNEN